MSRCHRLDCHVSHPASWRAESAIQRDDSSPHSPPSSFAMPERESYLIVGGCGFLGRHIVEQLLARGETQVSVFDIVQRHFDR